MVTYNRGKTLMLIMPLSNAGISSTYELLIKHLRDEILNFWLIRAKDRLGYKVTFDEAGNYVGEHSKGIVAHSRLIWAFLTAYEFLRDSRYLDFAIHGISCFLKFWDSDYGGWYWKLDLDGKPIDPNKRLYGQAFALLALAKLYRILNESRFLDLYIKTLEILNEKASYKDGFYHEFTKDWKIKDSTPKGCWSMNSLMHFIEALMEGVKSGISEAHGLLSNVKVFFKETFFEPFGTHIAEYMTFEGNIPKDYYAVNIGHNLEVSWMFYELDEKDISRKLLEFAINNGWDKDNGGFYEALFPYRNMIITDKVWWVQAEALSALATFKTYDLLNKQISWCLDKQADHKFGEWYAVCYTDGKVKDPQKGSEWKVCYHNTRGVVKTIISLRNMR